jgi:hypothetical protein
VCRLLCTTLPYICLPLHLHSAHSRTHCHPLPWPVQAIPVAMVKGAPLCMHMNKFLFSTTRVPHASRDSEVHMCGVSVKQSLPSAVRLVRLWGWVHRRSMGIWMWSACPHLPNVLALCPRLSDGVVLCGSRVFVLYSCFMGCDFAWCSGARGHSRVCRDMQFQVYPGQHFSLRTVILAHWRYCRVWFSV